MVKAFRTKSRKSQQITNEGKWGCVETSTYVHGWRWVGAGNGGKEAGRGKGEGDGWVGEGGGRRDETARAEGVKIRSGR